MREDLTYIAVILDKSGSMASLTADTIGGFNRFLQDQKDAPGDAYFLLVQFAERAEFGYSGPIAGAEPLSQSTYCANGSSTALYDAIGLTVDTLGRDLAALPEEERPGRVLVMIQTDGLENSSRIYNQRSVAAKIKHQREKYNWSFAFIGASEASIMDAVSLNIPVNFTAQYAATPAGTQQVFDTSSASLRAFRGMSTNEIKTKGGALNYFAGAGDSQGSSK